MKIVLLLAALIGAATCFFVRNHIYVNMNLNWTMARVYCRNNYVDLSTFDTDAEYDDNVNYPGVFWIGFNRSSNTESFTKWIDGRPFSFTKWDRAEPSNGITDNCGCSWNSKWHDCTCSVLRPFSCFTWVPQVIVVQEMKTWDEALEHCRTFYTDLICLPTESDLSLAKNKTADVITPRYWAGLRFLDGSWFWLNKEPLGNLVQLPSCPVQPFMCGALNRSSNVWENRDCGEKMNFVCYKNI